MCTCVVQLCLLLLISSLFALLQTRPGTAGDRGATSLLSILPLLLFFTAAGVSSSLVIPYVLTSLFSPVLCFSFPPLSFLYPLLLFPFLSSPLLFVFLSSFLFLSSPSLFSPAAFSLPLLYTLFLWSLLFPSFPLLSLNNPKLLINDSYSEILCKAFSAELTKDCSHHQSMGQLFSRFHFV